MAKNLATMAAGKSTFDKLKASTAPGGRVALRVFPSDVYDLLVLNGFEGRVWLKPGITLEEAKANAGLGAKLVGENGGVGLVLGAGNISSIAPLDVLYELVAFNRASILKLNPTFESLLPMSAHWGRCSMPVCCGLSMAARLSAAIWHSILGSTTSTSLVAA